MKKVVAIRTVGSRCWGCWQVVILPCDSSQPVGDLSAFSLKHKGVMADLVR